MNTLLVMAALAAVCWVFRIAFIVLVPAERLPAGVRRGLGHLAPAVLAALVAVELLELLETTKDSSPLAIWLVLVAVVVKLTRNMTVAVALALGAALAIDLVVLA
jgi:branched-subunit amino acid transport protein